jgi:hypothetical protein
MTTIFANKCMGNFLFSLPYLKRVVLVHKDSTLFCFVFTIFFFWVTAKDQLSEAKNRKKHIQYMAVNEGDNATVDIDGLVSSLKDMIPNDLLRPSKCCIFKTPVILSRHNEKAYIPQCIFYWAPPSWCSKFESHRNN